MQSSADFLQSSADLCGILQKNADNFFPRVFYEVNFLILEKKYWKYWKDRYLKYICTGNTQRIKEFQLLCT